MPYPTTPDSLSLGAISPKSSALLGEGTGGFGVLETAVGDLGDRLDMDLDARLCALPAEPRGFETRLANDCELVDIWSSGTNLVL